MTFKKCCRTCKGLKCIGDDCFACDIDVEYTFTERDSFDQICEYYELDPRLTTKQTQNAE